MLYNVVYKWTLLLLLFIPAGLVAQIDREAILLEEMMPAKDSTGRLVLPYELAPLDTLISRARAYAPRLKSQDALREAAMLNREIEERRWMDIPRVFGNASYGTGSFLTNLNDGIVEVNTLAVRQNLFYNAGVTMTVSPWTLATRRRRLQVMDADIYRASFDLNVLEDKVAESVIERYQALLLAIEMQDIAFQELGNQRINAELAERYFQTGDISFAEYNNALEERYAVEVEMAMARNHVKRAYLLLKIIVGGKLH